MYEHNYICRKCGFEFSAIPGKEEPPDCPECNGNDIEKLEVTTSGVAESACGGPTKNPRFS